jgi:hypothetical protein
MIFTLIPISYLILAVTDYIQKEIELRTLLIYLGLGSLVILLQWKTTPKFTDWIYAKLTK